MCKNKKIIKKRKKLGLGARGLTVYPCIRVLSTHAYSRQGVLTCKGIPGKVIDTIPGSITCGRKAAVILTFKDTRGLPRRRIIDLRGLFTLEPILKRNSILLKKHKGMGNWTGMGWRKKTIGNLPIF